MKKFTLLLVFALIANVFLTSDLFGQIAYVGASSPAASASGGATTLTINKPAGLAVGNVMFAHIVQSNNDDNGLSDATRNGWTEITGSNNHDNSNRFRGTLLYRIADAADVVATSFAFTIDSDQDDAQGYIVAFSGVDVTGGVNQSGAAGGPFDVDPGNWTNQTSTSSVSATGVTTVTANAAIVMFTGLADNFNLGSWSTSNPGSLNEIFDNALDGPGGPLDLGIGAAWAIKSTTGATGNGTATATGSSRAQSVVIALKQIPPPSVTINPPALSTTTILIGGTVNLTATRSANGTWPSGDGNFTYTWSATGPAGLSFTANPTTNTGTTDATTASGFSVAGDYFITCTVTEQGTGGQTVVATNKKVTVLAAAPTAASLWATSSDGTQVSSFVVANGTYFSGPSNIFAPTFTGTGGGSSTAALGLSDKPTPATGTFYYLPNNSGNSGVVTIYGRNSSGTIAQVGTLDVNGGSTNNLGYVRLGMHPDGSGWILAGDGTTVYLVKFVPSGATGLGAATITVEDANITLVGGAASTFQNGDLCVSGSGNIYALANDGSGVTQIFRGTPNGASTTFTKVFDLLDNTGSPFTGRVNGVAFDLVGSIYVSTDNGLFYVDAATVNGPAGTVGCFLVWSGSGLQDLASNIFPTQSTLPVTLGAFTVAKQGDFAVLNWKTSTEINTDHFEVERSYDGVNFTSVAMKAAAGNTSSDVNYQHSDPINYNYPIVYYRLKTVDQDTRFSYSKIVALRLSNGPIKNLTVFPNPFTTDLKLQINSLTETTGTVRISNAIGQVVYNRNIILQKGENIVVLTSGLETLKPGMHLMEVITAEGKVTQKIIKR